MTDDTVCYSLVIGGAEKKSFILKLNTTAWTGTNNFCFSFTFDTLVWLSVFVAVYKF